MPSETTTACVRLLVFFRIRRGTFPYGVEDDASTISLTLTTHYINTTCVKLTIVTHLSFSERVAIANLSLFGAEAPDYVYIQPTPAATATPATAPATAAPVPASAFAAPAPAPLLTPQHQFSIALFERWSTRRTCVCLDAREARRAQ